MEQNEQSSRPLLKNGTVKRTLSIENGDFSPQSTCCYCWVMTWVFRCLDSIQPCYFITALFKLVPTDGNLPSLQYLAIITKSAINIRIYLFCKLANSG